MSTWRLELVNNLKQTSKTSEETHIVALAPKIPLSHHRKQESTLEIDHAKQSNERNTGQAALVIVTTVVLCAHWRHRPGLPDGTPGRPRPEHQQDHEWRAPRLR